MPRAPSSRLVIHRLMRDHFEELQQKVAKSKGTDKPFTLTTEHFKQMEHAAKVESVYRGGKPADEKDEETDAGPGAGANEGLEAQQRLDDPT